MPDSTLTSEPDMKRRKTDESGQPQAPLIMSKFWKKEIEVTQASDSKNGNTNGHNVASKSSTVTTVTDGDNDEDNENGDNNNCNIDNRAATKQLDVDEAQKEIFSLEARQLKARRNSFFNEIDEYYRSALIQHTWPDFLKPENIKDNMGRRPDHPDYDQSTLLVPSEEEIIRNKWDKDKLPNGDDNPYKKHFTPMLKQYWKIKSTNFDKIALFKVGKFYEIFYYDAYQAQHICDLKWMLGDKKAHVGFPEVALHQNAKKLVGAGKISIVVEQVETASAAKTSGKAEGTTVHRQACEVFTPGTVVHQQMIEEVSGGGVGNIGMGGGGRAANYLLVLRQEINSNTTVQSSVTDCNNYGSSDELSIHNFGFTLVDVTTGKFSVGYLRDSPDRSKLRTLLTQVHPSELIYNPRNMQPTVIKMLRNLPSLKGCALHPYDDRMGTNKTEAKGVIEKEITSNDNSESNSNGDNNSTSCHTFPPELDALLLHDACSFALATCVKYLESVLLKDSVLPLAQWSVFSLERGASSTSSSSLLNGGQNYNKYMYLDATALEDLEILRTQSSNGGGLGVGFGSATGGNNGSKSSSSGGGGGVSSGGGSGNYKDSLLHFLDRTKTPFGHRLMAEWLCSPLCDDIEEILSRQSAINYFIDSDNGYTVLNNLQNGLSSLPDMERQFMRICALGIQLKERKAIMYEDIISKRLMDFYKLLDYFEDCCSLVSKVRSGNMPERLKRLCYGQEGGGIFPELRKLNRIFKEEYMTRTFMGEKKPDKFEPIAGKNAAYDATVAKVKGIQSLLDKELIKLKKEHGTNEMVYIHRQPASRYEVEIAEGLIPKKWLHDSSNCNVTSNRKGFIRIQTPRMVQLLEALDEADQDQRDALYPYTAELFGDFHKYQMEYATAIKCIGELDVLSGMARRSGGGDNGEDYCIPEFVKVKNLESEKESELSANTNTTNSTIEVSRPILELRDCRHPVQESKGNGSFVPNDLYLPGQPSVIIVTGANMGGKSTILRQTCLAVIMAQVGFRVPASSMKLSPVDRIFTRVGASDSMIEGKSTFLMELEETSQILRYASRNSLAVLDELGRGTSTFDGAAIALSVLEYLTEKIKCRTLFATHYHLLGTHQSDEVAPYHMAIESTIPHGKKEPELIFLYKLEKGLCAQSHGRNVGKMAGLPEIVIDEAEKKSTEWREKHDSQGPELLVKEIGRAMGDEGRLRELFRKRGEWERCL